MKTQTDKSESIEQVECKRCGHKWYPKTTKRPESCSRCKSYRWNEEPEKKEKKS